MHTGEVLLYQVNNMAELSEITEKAVFSVSF